MTIKRTNRCHVACCHVPRRPLPEGVPEGVSQRVLRGFARVIEAKRIFRRDAAAPGSNNTHGAGRQKKRPRHTITYQIKKKRKKVVIFYCCFPKKAQKGSKILSNAARFEANVPEITAKKAGR